MKLQRGEIYLAKGECDVELLKGSIEMVGKILQPGEKIFIPGGKNIPIEVIEETEIRDINNLERLESRTIPKMWDELTSRVLNEKPKVILVLGEMDTGKSFFATYIANKLLRAGLRVSVLDCDVGQSDIGPPGTIGLLILKKPVVFFSQQKPSALSFIGAHSPGLHFLPLITGIVRLKQKALSLSDILIVNTSGWITGDGGRLIKRAKMEILQPDIIVLMQRTDELEHLVKIYNQNKIVRLVISKKASDTNKSERENLRNLASQNYFSGSRKHRLSLKAVATDRCFFRTGKRIDNLGIDCIYAEKLPGYEGILVVSEEPLIEKDIKKLREKKFNNIKNIIAGDEKGLLVGLLDETGEVLSLGIVDTIDYEKETIDIWTPDADNRIRIIQFGSLRYTPEGKENGFYEPGYF